MEQLYRQTIEKTQTLECYRVIELWECEYDQKYKEDSEFRQMVDAEFTNLDSDQDMHCLVAEPIRRGLYHDIDPRSQDEIRYIDVCLLYPFICKYGLFPFGHPTILSQENIDKDNIQQYCGLIKCKVLSPRDLYHPVLPYKSIGKFISGPSGSGKN